MRNIGLTIGQMILNYRKVVLTALAIVTLSATAMVTQLRFDNALESWFVKDDPALLAHRRMTEAFTSDDILVIGYAAPDVFTVPVLELIGRVSDRVNDAPHVEKVFSLTRTEAIDGKDDTLEINELVEFPIDETELPALRRRVLGNDSYVGNIVSASGDFALILARLPHRAGEFQYKIEAVEAVREILAAQQGEKFYLAGGPVLDEVLFEYTDADGRKASVLMLVALVVALSFLLRSATGVLLPLATVSLSVLWTYGCVSASGRPLSAISSMLSPLLLAVGVADSLHFLVDYQNRLRKGAQQRQALLDTYAELIGPMTLTTATTALGLASLLVSRVETIREFGMFGALGVIGAYVLSITLVPIAASYAPPMAAPAANDENADDPSATEPAWLVYVHDITVRHGVAIAGVSAALVIAALASATQVRVESAFLEFFRDGDPIKVDTRRIEQAVSGTLSVEVVIDSGEDGGVKNPDLLHRIAEMQDFLESQPTITSSIAITDSLKDMRRALHDGDEAAYKLPESRPEAAQYLLLYEMDAPDGDINDLLTFDHRATRVSARMITTTSTDAVAVVRAAEQQAARLFPPPASVEVTGISVLFANMDGYIRSSLVRGFSLALFAIFVVLCIHMRSVTYGAMAMVPNAVPIVLCLGFMGATGIRLDSMTCMVASITIGLAVDDTIHFVSRVRLCLDQGMDMVAALRNATLSVGRALLFTSLCLLAGFSAMMTAHLVTMINFGMLCLLTVVLALAADLLLLPVLLRWAGGDGEQPVTAGAELRMPRPVSTNMG